MILKQVQVVHIRCVTLSLACNLVLFSDFTWHGNLRKSWAVIDQSNSHARQTWSCTLTVWYVCSLLEGLLEKRNCNHILSNCSKGMAKKNYNGSAYLQTLTHFVEISSITELSDEVQRLKLRNNQVSKLSGNRLNSWILLISLQKKKTKFPDIW